MPRSRVAKIVRNFQENGMKLLLEDPRNVRDLFGTAGVELMRLIDYDTLERVKTTFIHRDYRHVEADVVLVASLRSKARMQRPRTRLMIYVLLEHQSEPDRLMPLRLLEYVIEVFKFQERQWLKTHPSSAGIYFAPVLPVAFYTGIRRWDSLGNLADLIEPRKLAERYAPAMESVFLTLPAIDPERLEAHGGFFGWVLRLVQERKSRPERFRALLRRAVAALEAMPPEERLRWLELLSYVYALVYHVRGPSERPALHETIEASVRTDQHRQELFDMGKTIAEELKEEGISEGMLRARRQTLIRLLRKRFGEIPEGMVRTIETTRDAEELDRWLDNFATAENLSDVGLGPAR